MREVAPPGQASWSALESMVGRLASAWTEEWAPADGERNGGGQDCTDGRQAEEQEFASFAHFINFEILVWGGLWNHTGGSGFGQGALL